MTDILALIERANIVCATDDARRKPWLGTDVKGLLREMAEALSLAVSPLPEEIAGLIDELAKLPCGVWTEKSLELRIAAALERLARENEQKRQINVDLFDECVRTQARIRELEDLLNRQKARAEEEAELRGNALNDLDEASKRIRELEAERDEAIKLKKFFKSAHDSQVEDKDTIAGWLAKVEAERDEWRSAARYDPMMTGPRFKGWDRSQLDRCRKQFIETVLNQPQDKPSATSD